MSKNNIEKEIGMRIGMLRQWLNEDRITDKEMVTNEQIEGWLKLKDLIKQAKEDENIDWVLGKRCWSCGGVKKNDLSDTCGKCLEEE